MEPSSTETVAHLYAHIPFCASKCPYCAFVTHVGSTRLIGPYLRALSLELESRHRTTATCPLESIYLGGGTPSILSAHQVSSLLGLIFQLFGTCAGCEVSLEAHPSTVDTEKLRAFLAAGVTRLSFGVESLDSTELALLDRRHSAQRVLDLVAASKAIGFQSVNVDLMYGIPSQTSTSWEHTLLATAAAEPNHLSLYPLMIEPNTTFARRWNRGLLPLPADDRVVEMYHLACALLADRGYIHYEVSNWAKPGHQCRHNLATWHNRQLLGVGVGAHGYIHPMRTRNLDRTPRYVNRLLSGGIAALSVGPAERADPLADTIMLGLRLLDEGLNLHVLRRDFGFDFPTYFAPQVERWSRLGFLEVSNDRVRLTERAVVLANEIWADLTPDLGTAAEDPNIMSNYLSTN